MEDRCRSCAILDGCDKVPELLVSRRPRTGELLALPWPLVHQRVERFG
jgi:hypothetical protein